jgi:hypothetical protein
MSASARAASILGAGLLLAHATVARADPAADTARQLAAAAATDPWADAFVRDLTTEVGQRLAGTEAQVRAADWAEARLKAAGFVNVHREPFPMTAWVRGAETAQITAPTSQRLVLTALGGSVATPPGGLDAEIVVFHRYADLLAAAPGSLDGKIAVVTEAMVRVEDGSGYGAANPIRRAGPSEAAKRGAIAYLHRSLGTDSHRLPHTGKTDYADGVPKIPAAALSIPDAEQLDRLSALGPVKIHLLLTPTSHENAQSSNVVGEITGREKPDEIVLIGGHLDSWDLGTGAIDDGAGAAIMAGAAHLIQKLPTHPKRTVRLVLFGAEEMDYSGKAYAKAHADEAPKIMLAAEADFGTRAAYSAMLPLGAVHSPFAEAVTAAIEPLGVIVSAQPAKFAGSDVEGLEADGVPVIAVRQNGLDYFDIHHTADDTYDKIDQAGLAQNVGIWASIVYLAAEDGVDFRALAAADKPAKPAP